MLSLNSTPSQFVRPEFFIIAGFSGVPYANYYYTFLFLCYAGAVVGNLLIMTIIIVARSLHTPKYMVVFNLALADLGESNALIPSLAETCLHMTQKISYEACMVTMFSELIFSGMQSLTLTVLAYDRFVAICFPLRYHSIVTNTSMGTLVAVLWLFIITLATLMVSSITRLSFCHSVMVKGFYCAYGHVFELSCSNLLLTFIFATIAIAFFYFIPMILIGLSYASILLALFNIASWEERLKALKTCFSHLLLVCVYYVPLVSIDVAAFHDPLNINARVIGTALSLLLPTVLNPIVYTLCTAEIREFIKKIFNRNRAKTNIPAVTK